MLQIYGGVESLTRLFPVGIIKSIKTQTKKKMFEWIGRRVSTVPTSFHAIFCEPTTMAARVARCRRLLFSSLSSQFHGLRMERSFPLCNGMQALARLRCLSDPLSAYLCTRTGGHATKITTTIKKEKKKRKGEQRCTRGLPLSGIAFSAARSPFFSGLSRGSVTCGPPEL